MAQGRSLHIGVNKVDARKYAEWFGDLNACEADAHAMSALAEKQKFAASRLLTSEATREAVLAGIGAAAKDLKAGDIFLLTYAGHGSQLPDLNGDESDRLDETWCLYDGHLVDDELHQALAQFDSGVRIISISDSCHSESVVRAVADDPIRFRSPPKAVALRTYAANRDFYDPILRDPVLAKAERSIVAPTIHLSACRDDEAAAETAFSGAFTAALLSTWADGAFVAPGKGYGAFHRAIAAAMRTRHRQSPQLGFYGTNPDALHAQPPFSI